MNSLSSIMALAPLFLAAACSQSEQKNEVAINNAEAEQSAYPTGAAGTLISPGGNELGSVQASDGPDGVVVVIDARGLQPGTHQLQIHTVGQCQGPNFVSAGPGQAGGVIQNVTIESDGLLKQTVKVPGARLAQVRDADGSSLVLHMNADNPPTDPSGNAGDRIACAII
ncbi:MAG: superoxide dismutase family protein [Alphaproteobacteria bacterium]